MRRVLLLSCVVTIAGACGGRTPPGGRAVVVGDGGAADAPSDGPVVAPACGWSLMGVPVRVSGDPKPVAGDVALEDAIPTTGGALVAWVTPGDLMNAQASVTRLVDFDLASFGDEHVILHGAGPAAPLTTVSLAHAPSGFAIAGYDGAGCAFHPITLDGASNGSLSHVDPRRCERLTGTAAGFDVLAQTTLADNRRPDLDVVHVDTLGQAAGPPVRLFAAGPNETISASARAQRPDGTFVAAALRFLTTNPTYRTLATRAFAAGGAPIAPETTLASNPQLIGPVAMVPTAGGALAAWVAYDTQRGHVWAAALDRFGAPLAPPSLVADGETSITALHLAPETNGGALVAWTEYATDGPSSVQVLVLDASAAPVSAPMRAPDPTPNARYAPTVRVVATDTRGLLLFGAHAASEPHRIWAAPLSCR